jgi:Sec-independent protein translocase protein TatA
MAFVPPTCARVRAPAALSNTAVCAALPARGSSGAWGARMPARFVQTSLTVAQQSAARWTAQFGGGFLGVGPSEAAVILLVGWFVLGPQKLLTLSRDVGRIVGDLRRAADDAKNTFTEALEIETAAEQEKLESEAAEKVNANVDRIGDGLSQAGGDANSAVTVAAPGDTDPSKAETLLRDIGIDFGDEAAEASDVSAILRDSGLGSEGTGSQSHRSTAPYHRTSRCGTTRGKMTMFRRRLRMMTTRLCRGSVFLSN